MMGKKRVFTFVAVLGWVFAFGSQLQASPFVKSYAELQRYTYGQYALIMRQQGLTPETAQNAVWALRYNNAGPCSYWAQQLVSNRDAVHGGFRRDLGDLVVNIEQSGVCSKAHLRDKIEQPKKAKYDPKKDPNKITQSYFRNHHDDGVNILIRAGVTKDAAERAARLVSEDGTYSDCNTMVGMILEAMRTGDTGLIDAYRTVDTINKGLSCRVMEYSQP